MSRTVDEWIGKTPETPAPPRVRLRVFERYNGTCYLSGRKIMPGDKWHIEHLQALINGVDKGTIACIVHRKTWRHI